MSDTAAHEYAREGNIDALNEYISSNPNDIDSKNIVRILVYICYYIIIYIINTNLIIIKYHYLYMMG